MTRNGTSPQSQIRPVASAAMPRLVAMVETQGATPERIRPMGSLCCKINSHTGPTPNITAG